MKTLILNGSTKRQGDTAALIGEMRKHLAGEVLELSCFDGISPCTDCRDCWDAPGCSLHDALRPLYPFFESCDNLVLASPVWFGELSGPLLNLASRLVQPYFAARRFRGESPAVRPKRGAILLAAGNEKGGAEGAAQTARFILKCLGATEMAHAFSLMTDERPAASDEEALQSARAAGLMLSAPLV